MVEFDLNPNTYALLILVSGTIFVFMWLLDSVKHKELVGVDISDPELQTHRNILVASVIMEISLILFYWSPLIALPLFIASLITRLSQEFIDEMKFHATRCTPYESYLHIGMWISVYVKTFAMFIWGITTQYKGVLELPLYLYIWALILIASMLVISYREWNHSS